MLLANRNYNLFNEMFRNTSSQIMKTDIHEKDGNYMIEMELPGYDKSNIKADLKDGYLTISATKEETKEEKDDKGNCLRKERYTGSCNRSFYVGNQVTQEDVKAAFKDGVLSLQVPKEIQKVSEEPKLIEIQ